MSKKIPAYCLHKASGQACVKLVGKHGTPESHLINMEEISKWPIRQTESTENVTVGQRTLRGRNAPIAFGPASHQYVKRRSELARYRGSVSSHCICHDSILDSFQDQRSVLTHWALCPWLESERKLSLATVRAGNRINWVMYEVTYGVAVLKRLSAFCFKHHTGGNVSLFWDVTSLSLLTLACRI